ncbi:hypothetical protein OROHE_008132 [Orobanche hederae]
MRFICWVAAGKNSTNRKLIKNPTSILLAPRDLLEFPASSEIRS